MIQFLDYLLIYIIIYSEGNIQLKRKQIDAYISKYCNTHNCVNLLVLNIQDFKQQNLEYFIQISFISFVVSKINLASQNLRLLYKINKNVDDLPRASIIIDICDSLYFEQTQFQSHLYESKQSNERFCDFNRMREMGLTVLIRWRHTSKNVRVYSIWCGNQSLAKFDEIQMKTNRAKQNWCQNSWNIYWKAFKP